MTWGVRDLVAGYHRAPVVRAVSLDLVPGTVSAVVGADGAGKTTLLRCLAGSLAPLRGRLDLPPQQRIGYVPEGAGSYPDLSVAENLDFVARAYGVAATDRAERTRALLGATGLNPAIDRLAGQLSGGMRQKLAFAAAMLPSPDLLLLDEATTGLDPVSRRDLWRLVTRAAARGTAVLLATSYLDEAERAGHVVVLDGGRVLLEGPPRDVIGSLPGTISEDDHRADPERSWRYGRRWRTWHPNGTDQRISVGLEDTVLVELLRRRDQTPTAPSSALRTHA